MTDLRRYDPSNIRDAANELRERFEAGTLSTLEFTLGVTEFRFRDDKGSYWFLDARTNHWYRFDQGRWQASPTEPKGLEGPASLSSIMPTLPDEEVPDDEPIVQDEGSERAAPTDVLRSIVQDIGLAYAQGHTSSMDAEELLAQQFVIDNEGRFWTVGVRSSGWYYFEEGEWKMAEEPPPLESLLRLELAPKECEVCGHAIEGGNVCLQCGAEVGPTLTGASDQAYGAIFKFLLLAAGSMPEQVTELWDPPPGFPEEVTVYGIRCASCGAPNPPASRFCNQCGASLGCPRCQAPLVEGAKFCHKCGTPL